METIRFDSCEMFCVVQVKKDGKVMYAKDNTCLGEGLVENPNEAHKFKLIGKDRNKLDKYEVGHFLANFNYPGLSSRSRSGIDVDEKPKLVKFVSHLEKQEEHDFELV